MSSCRIYEIVGRALNEPQAFDDHFCDALCCVLAVRRLQKNRNPFNTHTMIQNYDALTVGKYEAIQRAQRRHADDVNRRNLAILSVLTNKSENELLDMPLPQFRALMDKASFLRRPLRPAPVARRYTLGEMTLRPTVDVQKMTTAQYIDFQTLAKQADERAAEMLSCFLLPEGHRYNSGYDIREVQRAIRNSLTVTDAHGLLAFFFKTSQQSTIDTLRSSAAVLKKTNRKKKDKRITEAMLDLHMSILLLRAGDGSRMSTPLLR